MAFYFIESWYDSMSGIGSITLDSFEAAIPQTVPPYHTVFIFPGNNTHHTKSTTLYSIKEGGGLAAVAGEIGTAGHPVLSLPTTGMDNFRHANFPHIQTTVEGAMADLYKALGA